MPRLSSTTTRTLVGENITRPRFSGRQRESKRGLSRLTMLFGGADADATTEIPDKQHERERNRPTRGTSATDLLQPVLEPPTDGGESARSITGTVKPL